MNGLIEWGALAIIRPPRSCYDEKDLLDIIEIENYGSITRFPVHYDNSQGILIKGSLYLPNDLSDPPPCVIYLHGNASCQLEGRFLIPLLVPLGIGVMCIDTSGSGNSGGEYISLGAFEKDDVMKAIQYLNESQNITRIALWGRSMGAAVSLLSISECSQIECAVVDSPFSSLSQLVKEISKSSGIAGCFSGLVCKLVGNCVRSLANFDINNVNPIQFAPKCQVPIRIIHAIHDSFINISHSRSLIQAYKCADKELWEVPGEHNSERPRDIIINSIKFICGKFGKLFDESALTKQIETSSNYHFAGLEDMIHSDEEEDNDL